MYVLSADKNDFNFPPPELASREGLLAIGGDLRCERLLAAYRQGVFPWYNDGQPILWWSPDPRAILFPNKIKISRSLRKTLKSGEYEATLDTAFQDVMQACAAPRHKQGHGTWITHDMVAAYVELHRRGFAHSVEIRRQGELVGGLYGVALGGAFFGESMFSLATDASKVALVRLAQQLQAWGFKFIDCQLPTTHLLGLGAEEMPRKAFLELLNGALLAATRTGPWAFDIAYALDIA